MTRSHHGRLPMLALALATLVSLAAPSHAEAQGWGDRLKKKAQEAAKRKVEERTDKRAGDATDAALDKAECSASDKLCKEKAAQQAAAGASGAAGGAAASAGKPGEGAWRNYDFVPGERVLFAEDFAGDNVGDFPKRLTFRDGNLEIVEWEGARFLSTNTFTSSFSVPLPEVLPERFTLEFLYSASGGNHMKIYFVDPERGTAGTYVEMGEWNGGIDGGVRGMGQPAGDQFKFKDKVIPVRVMADGKHVKVYMGQDRVANVPNANLGRSKAIYFVEVPGRPERAAMIGNIRVAAGGRDLYDALAAKGRVATQGVLFESGSDRLRPESTPTLTQIGRMLESHADLKLTIEGHTDNVGEAGANQALSEKRAAAVKAYLVSKHGIADDRLVAKGFGAAKPAAPNATAEGRQQNRRVELVKM